MYSGRSSPNKLLTWLRGCVPPSIFLRVLLKDEVHPKEVDGWFSLKKVVRKKDDDESPRIWYYTSWDDTKRPKMLNKKKRDRQPQPGPETFLV